MKGSGLMSGRSGGDLRLSLARQWIFGGWVREPERALALLETMAILVQDYDDRQNPQPSVPPNEMIAYLMRSSRRTTRELLPVFGPRGRVSEVLSGKRSVSKEQARKLASLFKITVDLFI